MSTTVRPTAQVEIFVEVLGEDLAIEFLMKFGGAMLSLSQKPRESSELVQLVGIENAIALGERADRIPARIPMAKPYIASVWRTKGLPVQEIARKLRASDVAVRGWLKKAGIQPAHDPRQTSLFD